MTTQNLETIRQNIRATFSWRLWLRGLIGAVIGSLGNAVTLMVTDPATYNIFDRGNWTKLGSFCIGSAVVSAGLYIKTHQIPAPPTGTTEAPFA